MNFSKRSRYGIRALIYLAWHSDCACIQLNDIAERNGISLKYLEQIFAALRKAGIVKSIKGPQGGYFLAGIPASIRVADIVSVLDGNYLLETEEIPSEDNGGAEALAVQSAIIDPVNEYIDQFLNTLTLKDLVERSEQYREAVQDMYYI